MGSFSTLEIGKRALLAQNLGIDIISNNVANINTPGYSRRLPVTSQTQSNNTMNGYIGTGSMMDKLRNFRDELFDKEIRNNVSRGSGYSVDESILKQVEGVFSEPGDNNIGTQMTDFFNSFETLSSNPQDTSLRNDVLDKAKTLVDTFHKTSQSLTDLRNNVLTDIKSNVTNANDIISQIAGLNSQISGSKSQTGDDSISLIDQREVLLEKLSDLADVNVTKADSGMVNVFMNGINVVTGQNKNTLQVVEKVNSTTGEKSAQIYTSDSSGNAQYTISPQSGQLASELKHYNVTLDNLDSSGGYSVFKNLDSIANSLANKVNTIAITGYGLNDTGSTSPARSFFDPAVGAATAANIQIGSDIVDKPENIPMSDAPNEPGNGNIGLKIADLATDDNFVGGQTAAAFYAGITGKIGTMENEATNGQNTTKLLSDQLTNQRESVIGVNLDEEAVNLIKFQKAFEASSRIINTTSEMLTAIINLGK